MRTEQEDEDEQFKVLYELCSMIIHVVRCPPPLTFPSPALYSPEGSSSSSKHLTASAQISPLAFASLFLGISLALMLFGSLTFVIGIILMPWVIGFVLLFYFAGIVSNLFEFGGSLLGLASSWKDMSGDSLPSFKWKGKAWSWDPPVRLVDPLVAPKFSGGFGLSKVIWAAFT